MCPKSCSPYYPLFPPDAHQSRRQQHVLPIALVLPKTRCTQALLVKLPFRGRLGADALKFSSYEHPKSWLFRLNKALHDETGVPRFSTGCIPAVYQWLDSPSLHTCAISGIGYFRIPSRVHIPALLPRPVAIGAVGHLARPEQV